MPPLRAGMAGDDVVSLQLALVAVGLLAGDPTGGFDETTRRAVVEMQRRSGLAQTGVMDDASWNALYQMQVSVAPTDSTTVGTRPGTTYLDPVDVTGGIPSRSQLLFWGLLAGGAYWYTHKPRQQAATNEFEDDEEDDEEEEEFEEEEEEDDEDDEADFEPPSRRSLRDLDDSVTDSLIDEPAVISSSGRAGDCKKAAMLLLRRQGIVQRPSERELQRRTIGKVAQNCREHETVLEDAIVDAQLERDEAALDVGSKLIRSHADTAHMPRDGGFRKTKFKLTKKTTSDARQEGVRGRGRRGSSAVSVRRGGKEVFRMQKRKTSTKRGYKWDKDL